MPAGVEERRGVLAVADAERFGARQAGQRDLARRRLPGAGVRLFPAEMPPPRTGVERRAAIMADAEAGKAQAAIGRHDRTGSSNLPVFDAQAMPAAASHTGGSSAAA